MESNFKQVNKFRELTILDKLIHLQKLNEETLLSYKLHKELIGELNSNLNESPYTVEMGVELGEFKLKDSNNIDYLYFNTEDVTKDGLVISHHYIPPKLKMKYSDIYDLYTKELNKVMYHLDFEKRINNRKDTTYLISYLNTIIDKLIGEGEIHELHIPYWKSVVNEVAHITLVKSDVDTLFNIIIDKILEPILPYMKMEKFYSTTYLDMLNKLTTIIYGSVKIIPLTNNPINSEIKISYIPNPLYKGNTLKVKLPLLKLSSKYEYPLTHGNRIYNDKFEWSKDLKYFDLLGEVTVHTDIGKIELNTEYGTYIIDMETNIVTTPPNLHPLYMLPYLETVMSYNIYK